MNQIMQNELDIAEEYILKKLFLNIHNPVIGSRLNTLCAFLRIDKNEQINKAINAFEKYIGGFLTQDGLIDGEILSILLSNKFPFLSGLKIPNARLLDVIKMIDKEINLDNLGEIIRR